MNFTYIIIGLFFLLNPNINIIDILPDFIGYAFIIRGMMKYSSICENFKISYSFFKKLLWLNLIKIPCLSVYFMISANDTVWLLLFSFCFGIFEAYFAFKAFGELFDGFVYSAMRVDTGDSDDFYGNEITTAHKLSTGVFNKIDFIRRLTLGFVIGKVVMYILPELTLLSSREYGEVTQDGIISLADYRYIFIAISCVITLAIGVFWFGNVKKYFKGIAADKEYNYQLEEKHKALLDEDSFMPTQKRLFFAFSFFILGTVFLISLPFDGINYVPRAIGGVLYAIAFYALTPLYGKISQKAYVKSLVFSGVSLVVWIYQFMFMLSIFKEYLFSDQEGLAVPYAYVLEYKLQKSFDTLYLFVGSVILSFIEVVFMIILLLAMKKLIQAVISDHTGVASLRNDLPENSEDNKAIKRSLNSNLNASVILGIIATIFTAVQVTLSTLVPAFWVIDFVVRLIYIAVTIILFVRIKEAVKGKYFIE